MVLESTQPRNRNEYQKYLLGVKAAGVGVKACNGIGLTFLFLHRAFWLINDWVFQQMHIEVVQNQY
jgi:hypothetical protein